MKYYFITTFLLFTLHSFSQCPNNIKNCKGQCGLYIDVNKDGYCDKAVIENNPDAIIKKNENEVYKLKQNKKTNVTSEKSKIECSFLKNKSYEEKINTDTTVDKIKSKNEASEKNIVTKNNSATAISEENGVKPPAATSPYHFIGISVSLIFLYVVSLLLVRKKKVKKTTHTKIWNSFLLMAFLFPGLIGIFLVLKINYGFHVSFLRQLYVFHVDCAVGFAVIAIIHVWKHRKFFYKIIFSVKEK
ncbi:MAG: hypothetical protein WC223_06505 [Bacteroidales bacterium]|jgi:hypothetical protein